MNESLKKAQAAYQEKCRIINLRFNKESESDLIEWLDFQRDNSWVSSAIKKLIRDDYKRLKEHKTRVNFYSTQVKYHGNLEDYTTEQLLEMAKADQDRGIDTFDHDIITDEIEARKLDGKVQIDDRYPCNKICVVSWSYIDDNYWWEQEEDE